MVDSVWLSALLRPPAGAGPRWGTQWIIAWIESPQLRPGDLGLREPAR